MPLVRFLIGLTLLLTLLVPAAGQEYFHFSIDQDALAGAPDFSHLNQPLTAAGRVFVRDGHFYTVGPDREPFTADDRRIRFYGMNLAFAANFPEEKDAARIAKRLRRLGVNLVRLHHLDTSPDEDPENARSILTTGPYPALNPVSVRRLKVFLGSLAAEGIYANLNLHVGYRFRPGIDDVPRLPAGMEFPTHSKPLQILHPRLRELQVVYTRRVIGALGLAGNPVLAMVEINNESSPIDSWQRNRLDTVLVGDYRDHVDAEWRRYRDERGKPALSKDSDDYLLFLADQHRVYLDQMAEAVREATDNLVPLAGTQLCFGGMLNYDSHEGLDYQDHHFYVDHYNFPGTAWDARDWRIRDLSAAGSGFAALLNMAAGRQAGRPYTVSEYNQAWPNSHSAEINPALAVLGAFQDWDSIMHFAYAHGRNWDGGIPRGFDADGDWTQFPVIGQSAWLFRSAVVETGRDPVDIPISLEARLRATRERRNGNIAAFLTGTFGFDPNLAFQHPVRLAINDDGPMPDFTPLPDPPRSDTGQIRYDPAARVLTLAAPQAAAVIGFAASRTVTAGELSLQLTGRSLDRGFAVVVATALDGRPLRESARILLSIPGAVMASQPGTDPPRPQRLTTYKDQDGWWTLEPEPDSSKPSGNRNGGVTPTWMRRVESFVTLRTEAEAIRVYPLDGKGSRLAALPKEAVEKNGDSFRIHLQADGQQFSPWYEIVR